MDKLYASTNAVGVVTELLLAVLNTNVLVNDPGMNSAGLTFFRSMSTKSLLP